MNTVHLSGVVDYVSLKDMGTWIKASLKVNLDGKVSIWVAVQGIEKGKKDTETLPTLKDKPVVIEGYLSSYSTKPKTDQEQPETRYEISTTPRGIQSLPSVLTSLAKNHVLLKGKVESTKENSSGDLFAQISIRYYKPKLQEYGVRLVRIRCPKDTKIEAKSYVVVTGTIQDNNGPYVSADAVQVC